MLRHPQGEGILRTKARVTAALLLMITAVSSAEAAPIYFTFNGTINNFTSYNSDVTLADFDVQLGSTAVTYVYEVDFDANTSTTSNSSGTWYHFYSDLLLGGIVNGENGETNSSYNVFFNSIANQGHMVGGSTVQVWTTDAITSNWQVQDWVVGQQLNLTDGGYLSTGTGGAVYFHGLVELTAISFTNPVPAPATLTLLPVALGFMRRMVARSSR